LAFVSLGVAGAAPASAVTSCSNVWYTIELGNNPGHFVRPDWDGPNAVLYGNGTAAQPWFNFFQLCRDPGWIRGDYALRANYGGRYVEVYDQTGDLRMGGTAVQDERNLLRIRNYDGNFQTLWSPLPGRTLYVGTFAPTNYLSAQWHPSRLNGTNLYRVRSVEAPPRLPDIPCDPRGTLPGPCQGP
jgi:hypothetical protein